MPYSPINWTNKVTPINMTNFNKMDQGILQAHNGTAIFGVSSNGANTYIVNPTIPLTAYNVGYIFNFMADVGNTGTSTLNISGLGSKMIKKNVTSNLVTGDIKAGQIVTVVFDGTNFQLISTNNNGIAGEVKYFAMNSAPSGYLKANGATISRTVYADLFAAIGTTYGAGDGSTTFNLPDLRGVFPRGWDDSRGYDSGRAFGSYQADDNKAHTHTGTTSSDGSHAHTTTGLSGSAGSSGGVLNSNAANVNTGFSGVHNHTFTTDSTGSTESRPKNIALLACIKH